MCSFHQSFDLYLTFLSVRKLKTVCDGLNAAAPQDMAACSLPVANEASRCTRWARSDKQKHCWAWPRSRTARRCVLGCVCACVCVNILLQTRGLMITTDIYGTYKNITTNTHQLEEYVWARWWWWWWWAAAGGLPSPVNTWRPLKRHPSALGDQIQ